DLTDQELHELSCSLAACLYEHMGLRRRFRHQNSPLHLQVSALYGGFELPSVKHNVRAAYLISVIESGLNSKSKPARDAAEYMWRNDATVGSSINQALCLFDL